MRVRIVSVVTAAIGVFIVVGVTAFDVTHHRSTSKVVNVGVALLAVGSVVFGRTFRAELTRPRQVRRGM